MFSNDLKLFLIEKLKKGISNKYFSKMTDNLCGGLPPEICEQLNKEEQFIKVKLERRRYGKEVTVIEGISDSDVELKKIASELKSKLAAGGTVKNGRIEIQGDHREKVKDLLIKLGFPESNIMVIE